MKWAFGLNYPEAYGGMALDLFFIRLFSWKNFKKVKIFWFWLLCMHAYLAMTHLNAEGDERIFGGLFSAKYCWKKIEHYAYRAIWGK